VRIQDSTNLYNTQGVVNNNEDLAKLLEKLQRQLKFVQDKTSSLADPQVRPSGAAVQGLIDSLQAYTSCVGLSLNKFTYSD
jgi:hypothetical protein